MHTSHHTVQIEPDEQAPGRGRAFIEEVLAEYPAIAGDAALIVSELVTNAVIHGDRSVPIALEVTIDKRRVRLSVATQAGHEVKLRMRSPNAPGGFGLSIVNTLASEWGIKRRPRPMVWCDLSLPTACS